MSADQFEEHRRHLRTVAYRMLGSASEAEDAVQETWIRLGRTMRARAQVSDADDIRRETMGNKWVRQIHRWLSIVFTVTVIANFVALAQGDGTPPPWVTYSPLLPLALLLFTGLYLFVLPYASTWRGARRTGEAVIE